MELMTKKIEPRMPALYSQEDEIKDAEAARDLFCRMLEIKKIHIHWFTDGDDVPFDPKNAWGWAAWGAKEIWIKDGLDHQDMIETIAHEAFHTVTTGFTGQEWEDEADRFAAEAIKKYRIRIEANH